MMLFSNCSCATHKNNFSHPSKVELGLTGPTSISTNIRTTCSKSLAVFVSNDSSLSVRPRILAKLSSKRHRLKPFEFSPHGLTDRLRLNCEPSSPMNAFSHILELNSEKQKRRPLPEVVRRTFYVLYGDSVQWSVSERFSSYPSVYLLLLRLCRQ